MLDKFKPTWTVDSIYEIKPKHLIHLGIRAVFTDLDNTLIAWNNPKATEETIHWIESLKEHGIQVIIISNNNSYRVKKVAEMLEIDFVSDSKKPFQKGFKKARKHIDFNKQELLMVGDQLLTDILGANLFNIRNVLVKPILETDAWNTKINRFIELKVINKLLKNDPNQNWRDLLDE